MSDNESMTLEEQVIRSIIAKIADEQLAIAERIIKERKKEHKLEKQREYHLRKYYENRDQILERRRLKYEEDKLKNASDKPPKKKPGRKRQEPPLIRV